MARSTSQAAFVALAGTLLFASRDARAQDPSPNTSAAAPIPAPPPPAQVVEPAPIFTGRLYGFIESRFDSHTPEPTGDANADGSPIRFPVERANLELPHFHIMAQGSIYSRFRYYFNLANEGDAGSAANELAPVIRCAWLEASILGDYLAVRIGKLYRRFGLYNEIIDTVPSFIGIETPVYISGQRPMLTRTTNAMIFGRAIAGDSTFSYALTGGQDEASPDHNVWSPGLDLSYEWNATVLVGTSYYTTAGTVIPSESLGNGSPPGGVAPWMKQDRFSVYGAYAKLTLGSFFLHAEGWISPHVSTRDPALVLDLAQNAAHFSRFNAARMASPDGSYTYSVLDARAGYTIALGHSDDPAELTPYVDFQYDRDVESISDQTYGGDGESGESPVGRSIMLRAGLVFKPVPAVAAKLELSDAMYKYPVGYVHDQEAWLSLSYAWGAHSAMSPLVTRRTFVHALSLFGALAIVARSRSALGGGRLVLVLHPSNARNPDLAQTKHFYMGDSLFWPDNTPVKLFLRPPDSPAGDAFYHAISVVPTRLKRVWQEKQLSGQGATPDTIAQPALLVQRIAESPGGVGFALEDEIAQGAGVRIVAVR